MLILVFKIFSTSNILWPSFIVIPIGRFPFQSHRSETYRVSLFREHSDRTNDMDTIEYATFRYDTFDHEVENGLITDKK